MSRLGDRTPAPASAGARLLLVAGRSGASVRDVGHRVRAALEHQGLRLPLVVLSEAALRASVEADPQAWAANRLAGVWWPDAPAMTPRVAAWWAAVQGAGRGWPVAVASGGPAPGRNGGEQLGSEPSPAGVIAAAQRGEADVAAGPSAASREGGAGDANGVRSAKGGAAVDDSHRRLPPKRVAWALSAAGVPLASAMRAAALSADGAPATAVVAVTPAGHLLDWIRPLGPTETDAEAEGAGLRRDAGEAAARAAGSDRSGDRRNTLARSADEIWPEALEPGWIGRAVWSARRRAATASEAELVRRLRAAGWLLGEPLLRWQLVYAPSTAEALPELSMAQGPAAGWHWQVVAVDAALERDSALQHAAAAEALLAWALGSAGAASAGAAGQALQWPHAGAAVAAELLGAEARASEALRSGGAPVGLALFGLDPWPSRHAVQIVRDIPAAGATPPLGQARGPALDTAREEAWVRIGPPPSEHLPAHLWRRLEGDGESGVG